MNQDTLFNFRRGQKVRIGTSIVAVIEEIILARNLAAPFYLVEYWNEGHLISRRMHEEDLEPVNVPKGHDPRDIHWWQDRPE